MWRYKNGQIKWLPIIIGVVGGLVICWMALILIFESLSPDDDNSGLVSIFLATLIMSMPIFAILNSLFTSTGKLHQWVAKEMEHRRSIQTIEAGIGHGPAASRNLDRDRQTRLLETIIGHETNLDTILLQLKTQVYLRELEIIRDRQLPSEKRKQEAEDLRQLVKDIEFINQLPDPSGTVRQQVWDYWMKGSRP